MAGTDSYDEVPYGSGSIFEMHPNRMASVARLFGLDPAPVRTARVLEIGCAEGGNAIAVAVSLPEARVVGIDLSERQVATGNARISAMGLPNVALVRADLAELAADLGPFDYVCAHGVYSWIAPALQDRLLRACHDLLAPDGIAYVSYNVHPGSRARLVLREIGRFRARREAGADRKLASTVRLLGAVAHSTPRGEDAYRTLLARQWALAEKGRDGYFFHEYLEDENNPCWFHEFAARSRAAGLAYVADALFGLPSASGALSGAEEGRSGEGPGRLDREQLLDFQYDASFRQSLLCRSEKRPLDTPDLSVLDRFHVGNCLRADGAGEGSPPGAASGFLRTNGERVATNDPLLAGAFAILRDRSPAPVPFRELAERLVPSGAEGSAAASESLRRAIVRAHAADLVELLEHVPAFATEPGSRPAASPLVRLQASLPGSDLTSLLHREIAIEDGLAHLLLARMDGTKDLDALASETAEAIVAEGMMAGSDGRPLTDRDRVRAIVREALPSILDVAARTALLLAREPGR